MPIARAGCYTSTMASPPASSPRRLRGRTVFLAIVGVIVVLVVPTVVFPTILFPPDPPAFSDDAPLPAFALTDHTGRAFTQAELAGHVTIVNFIFTRCDSVCPRSSMKMHGVQERTDDEPSIKLISITIDPEHDTVPVLAEYAATFRADPTRWRFVRGEPAATRALIEGAMMVGYDKVGTLRSGAPDISHSGHFVLIDRRGHLRGYYDSDDDGRIETLLRHARWLARQRS